MKKLLFTVIIAFITGMVSAQKVGIGTNTPQEQLHVVGNVKADTVKPAAIKLTTGAADGRVLTSDAAGNASWQNRNATGTSKCYMSIVLNSNTSGRTGFDLVGINQQDSVDFNTPRYNLGSDFTITSAGTTNNKLTLNNEGLYHFEGFVTFSLLSTVTNQSNFAHIIFATHESTGNTNLEITGREILYQNDFLSPFGYTRALKFSFDRYYTAGTEITLVTVFTNLSSLTSISVSNGYFSAYRISD